VDWFLFIVPETMDIGGVRGRQTGWGVYYHVSTPERPKIDMSRSFFYDIYE